MTTHHLKTWPEHFDLIVGEYKTFEIRKNDRGFEVGDTLCLQEWNPRTRKYTGDEVRVHVSHMIQGEFGLPDDVCVMSVRVEE